MNTKVSSSVSSKGDTMDKNTKTRILEAIELNKERLFEILSELIKINSENFGSRGNEKEMAEFVAEKLEAMGISSDVYPPDSIPGFTEHHEYLPGRNTDVRPNVTGLIKGTNPKGKLMFTAHIDTVPIGDQSLWKENPLGGEIKNGRIYGRGACDDKYAVATFLFIAEILKKLDVSLSNDLYFTGYCDEEFGGGNGALGACLKYPCDVYVNLDCKNMRIWNCAVGGRRETLTIAKNCDCITCDDMIDAICVAKEELHKFGENRRRELSENPLFAGTNIPNQSMRILCLQSGLNTNDRNQARMDFSYYTDKSEEEIRQELDVVASRINSRMEARGVSVSSIVPVTRYFRYAFTDRDNEYIRLLKNAGKEAIGEEIIEEASCLSDLNIFINNGSRKSFSFGIGRDFDVEGGAHLKDEFIECKRLVEYAKTIAAFVCDWDQK